VGTQTLLSQQVERGTATLRALDAAGLKIEAALWVFDESSHRWQFTVADAAVDREGTRALYERMIPALKRAQNTLPVSEIYAVSPNVSLVALVRKTVTTGPNAVDNIWSTGDVVEGTVLPDMLIHRMSAARGASATEKLRGGS